MSEMDKECPGCKLPNLGKRLSSEHGGTTELSPPPRARKTKVFAIPAVLLALLIAAAAGYYYWTTTPQYSLLQAKNAVGAHDLAAFEKYVDVDSCAAGFIDDAFAQVAEGAKSLAGQQGSGLFSHLGEQFAQGLMNMVKPSIVTAIKGRVRDYVEHGNTQDVAPGNNPALPGANLEQKARNGDFSFEGIQYVNRDGNTALVGLKFLSQKDATRSFTVELKMQQVEDHWQVVRWNNVADVFKELGSDGAKTVTT